MELSRYLVVVQLIDTRPSRLSELVPRLQDQLTQLSKTPIEKVFRSATADLFGYFIKTNMKAVQISAALQSPGPAYGGTLDRRSLPFLNGDDTLFILEVGNDFIAGQDFARPMTWLQRNS